MDNSTGAAKPSGSTMVVTSSQDTGVTRVFGYDADTPAIQIITDLSASTGMNLQPHSVKMTQKITETQKKWYEGIRIGASLTLKGGSFHFEVKPKKEIETITEIELRKPK